MSLIRTLVYYKLLADETIPTVEDSSNGPKDKDGYYSINNVLLKEATSTIAWVFKHYVAKDKDNKPSYKSL